MFYLLKILFNILTAIFYVFFRLILFLYFIRDNIIYFILIFLTLLLSCLYLNQKHELMLKTKELIELKNLLVEDYNNTMLE